MTDNPSPVLDYVDYIDMIPGVLNSNVVMDGNGICEVHILSDVSRSPKQLVRDIQSLFMAQFNKEVDHRVISIAQVDLCLPSKHPNRLAVEEVSHIKRKGSSEFQITLSYKGQPFSATRGSVGAGIELYRSISQATLDCVAAALSGDMAFSVQDVRFCDLADKKTVVICVSIKKPNGSASLYAGCAFLNDDIETAVVRATLCAINRRLFNA